MNQTNKDPFEGLKPEPKKEKPTDLPTLFKLEQDKTKICLKNVTQIREKEFKFDEGTKDEKTVKRYIYEINNGDGETKAIIIPKTVHEQILTLRATWGTKLINVEINKTGKGINTRYSVIPLPN